MKLSTAASALLVVVFHAALGFAQAFDGLEPGRSTRSEVERAYGAPSRELSATLVEYRSAREAEQIFVQYRKSSDVVERVEKISGRPAERSRVLAALSLPQLATASRVNDKGRLEEYFASERIVLTFVANDEASGVARLARYSRELFASATSDLPKRPPGGGGAPAPSAGTYLGCFKDTPNFDLDGYLERSTANLPQKCVVICAGKGFAYAAVQYGESCLCGDRYGKYGPATNCDYACTGDAEQICGGYNANSVYTTGVQP